MKCKEPLENKYIASSELEIGEIIIWQHECGVIRVDFVINEEGSGGGAAGEGV